MRPRDVAAFFVAMLVVVITWAVGIPKFASPDETGHVFKAYGTAHGQALGVPAPGFPNNLREFDGPDSLGPTNLQCFNGQPDVPAACATEVSPQLISSAARYPPWYYGLVGVPVAVAGQSESVFAYRFVSAALCVALLTLAMCLAKRALRADVVALQLVAITPMALFLMASVNPNAIEIAGFVAIWACLTRVTTDVELPRGILVLASLLSAAVVLMRPIAIVWIVGMVAVVLAASGRERRRELMSRRVLMWAIGPTAVALGGVVGVGGLCTDRGEGRSADELVGSGWCPASVRRELAQISASDDRGARLARHTGSVVRLHAVDRRAGCRRRDPSS